MGNKFLAWVFGIGAILNILNVYISYKSGNLDAFIAWITSTCFSVSALGAYLKLIYTEEDKK